MAHLAIRLLGPFEVTLDGEPITQFETLKTRALLAYLAAEADSRHRREALAEMLWPDRPEGAARANLRHTLRSLRLAIGDYEAEPPFLLTTREAIALNPDGDAWVDVRAFAGSLAGLERMEAPDPEALEQALGLYRGAFLEDLSLPDSALFEEWRVLKREQVRRQVLDLLSRLVAGYERRGEYERALAHAWRKVDLEPWDETARRQVMRLLARSGRRAEALAQYEACRTVLADELGVEPETETTQLAQRIRDGELEILTPTHARPPAFHPPRFLLEGADDASPPLFVARDQELARLAALADQALQGTGRVAFVTGGPGQGKSALLDEFVRRAMRAHPELLVARGDCNAYAGAGDPYLPFRDVMAMLTGDLEGRWLAGSIRRDHARRLWDALPLVMTSLLAWGPSLIGTLVDGDALLSRLAEATPDANGWLEHLRTLAQQARTGAMDLEQSFLFEQCARVLGAVAEQHPLALVLDDVQWADNASIGLLFHLGRRLAQAGNCVLIVCAYRPEEVGPGQGGKRHPLEKVLREFKRTFGDVWVDLDLADQREGRRFVDAFLDAEPNRLGEDFRAALFHRTAGHPLFTIELLRSMQERGDLVRDEADGAWIQGPGLDWQTLPARVEAVIEARIDHLEPRLRQIASVASVEGEQFTAEVLAAVQGAAVEPLLQDLTETRDVAPAGQRTGRGADRVATGCRLQVWPHPDSGVSLPAFQPGGAAAAARAGCGGVGAPLRRGIRVRLPSSWPTISSGLGTMARPSTTRPWPPRAPRADTRTRKPSRYTHRPSSCRRALPRTSPRWPACTANVAWPTKPWVGSSTPAPTMRRPSRQAKQPANVALSGAPCSTWPGCGPRATMGRAVASSIAPWTWPAPWAIQRSMRKA